MEFEMRIIMNFSILYYFNQLANSYFFNFNNTLQKVGVLQFCKKIMTHVFVIKLLI
jgi:hypothetical protein